MPTFGRDGGNEDANGGPDEGRGIAHGVETFRPNEVGHVARESVKMRLDIIL